MQLSLSPDREAGWPALSAAVLFASSTLVFAWYPIAKTHSLAALLLFSAYVVLNLALEKSSPWRFLRRCSARSQRRLPFIPVAAFPGIRLVDRERPSIRTLAIAALVSSSAVSSWRTCPRQFCSFALPMFFCSTTCFTTPSDPSEGLIGWWAEKLVLIVQLFLGSPEGNGLQWSFLFILGAAFLSVMPRRDPCRLAFQVAVFLGLICLLPTPTYLQYFSLCVPFLIVSRSLRGSRPVRSAWKPRAARRSVIAGAAIVLVVVCFDLGQGSS